MYNFEKALENVSLDEHFDSHLKHRGKKLVEKIKAAGKKVADKVKHGDLTALYLPLVPMKAAMKKALDKKKVPHTNKIDNIARAFVQEIILPKVQQGHFDASLTDLEKEALKEQEKTATNAGVKIAAGDYVGGAGDIVKAITAYFKSLQKKKNDAKATEAEKKEIEEVDKSVDQAAEMTEDEIASEGKAEVPTSSGSDTTQTPEKSKSTGVLVILAIIAVLYIAS